MRKSNEELWSKVEREGTVAINLEAFAAAIRADEAEHAKAEQRKACAKAGRKSWMMGSNGDGIEAAILNAGVAPALKPGMLARGVDGISTPFIWVGGDPAGFRPCTKAEVACLHAKAPEEVV